MRSASKVWLVAALAVAATALAAGSAFATTISPAGFARGEAGQGNLDNGVISITCQSSVAIANLDAGAPGPEPANTSIESLTFADCTEDVTQADCTVVVDGLPQDAGTTYVSPDVGELALDGPSFAGANVDCGTLVCRADADDRLRGSVLGGSAPQLVIADQPIQVSGDIGCGVGLDGNWNSTWNVVGTGGPGDGTYPSTSLTISDQ
jgi:hypothetical protein